MVRPETVCFQIKLDKINVQKSQILSISLARKFDILPDKSTIDNQPLRVFYRWLVFYNRVFHKY